MAPLPGPNQLGGPGSLRSGRIIASFDTTAIGRGLQQLGAGLADVGMVAKANQEREAAEIEAKRKELIQQNNVVDVGYAEAEWTKRDLARRQTFATDTDYSTFGKRYDEQTANDIKEIAATIRDPAMRDRFTALKAQDLVTSRASILALGEQKRIAAEKARGYDTLDTMRNVFVDPNTDEATRARTRDAIKAQIDLNEQTGIFSPEEARQARKLNIEDANLTFAKLWADANPGTFEVPQVGGAVPVRTTDARTIMGRLIPAESSGNPNAVSPVGATGLAQVMPSTAPEIARELGDQNFPFNNPEQIREYLKDPEVSVRYGTHYLQTQLDRYGGETKAALIAYNAGPKRADQWLQSGRNDAVLPAETRDYVAKIMGGEATAPALDLGPDTQLDAGTFKSRHYTWQDLRNDRWSTSTVSSRAVNALDWVTDQFGSKLKITSGYRAPNHPAESAKARPGQHTHGQAIDIDVSGLSDAEKSRLVALFVQSGARGIGHYPPGSGGAGTIHVDFRQGRGKQADGLALWYGSQPYANGETWFKTGIEQGRASRGAGAPGVAAVPPNYGDLTPEQRYNYGEFLDGLIKEREAADRERRIQARVGLESVITNAPAAIQNTGRYDQPLPTVEQFVDAYGEEGFAKHEEFTAAVETSRDVFDMRTMSKDEIERTVADATPVSTGNDAALETKRYDALSNAASAILKARDADPVGYVMQTVPAVRQAWEGVQPGTDGFAAAVQATTAAQMALGIDPAKIQPLPKEMAGTAATMFGNVELPEGDRIGALTSAVFSTPDPEQRRAIFKQLVAAGVPEHVEGALQAFERGDEGAARRLVQAALIDPSKLPGKVPFKPLEIDESIQNTLLADGAVGDIYYGLSDGTVENFEKAKRDATLLNRAVTLRVMAGEDLATATEAAGKDLFGNVVPLPSDDRANAQILIPADTDPEPVLNMLQAYKRDVAMTLSQVARAEIDRANPAVGTRAVLETTVQNRIEDMMESGYFAERNGGYVFMDPFTGLPVAGMDGAPLVMDKTGYRAVTAPPAMVREQTLQERITGAAEEPTITVTPGRQRADTTGRAAGNMAERSVPVEQPAVAQPPQAPAEPSAPGMPGWQERTMQTLQGGGVPSPSDMTPSVGDVTGEALRRLLGGN
jgi:hypothetical protein